MSDVFAVHFEIRNVSSAVARQAADMAWEAIQAVVGDGNFDSSAERRNRDGHAPRDPRWSGWTDDVEFRYARREST